MKKILLLFFLIFSIHLFSQKYNISGKIVDDENHAVLFSEISLLHPSDSIVLKKESVSDKGFFNLLANRGLYILQVKYLDSLFYTKNISLDKNIDLGSLQIDTSKNLKEVIVKGKKKLIERKIDRLVFNVENSISATGGSALDAMKVTPGLKVRSTGIYMVGKSGMSVMIDGRMLQLSGEDLLNFLRTMRSDEISSIEVITTPPSKYDAQGNSGIVNIKRKKLIPNSWKSVINSRYTQGTYSSGGVGGSVDYQKNKNSFYFSINYDRTSRRLTEGITNYYPNTLWNEEKVKKSLFFPFTTRLNYDYKISSKLTTGISLYNSYSQTNPGENDRVLIHNKSTFVLDSLANSNKSLKNKYTFVSFNYHLNYDMDSLGKRLSFDFDYFLYKNKSDQLINGENFFPNKEPIKGSEFAYKNNGGVKVNNYNFTVDMEHPINSFNLNYGAKYSISDSDSDNSFFKLYGGSSFLNESSINTFTYKENILSLYASLSKKITSKLEGKLGFRLENVDAKGYSPILSQTTTNNYSKIYPTAYILYTPNENHTYNINYSKRVTRPRYFLFNPFRSFNNQYFYSEGNPFLQPSFSDNIELNYNLKNKFNVQFYYSKLKDGFDYVTIVEPNDIRYRYEKPLNYIKSNTYGINVSYTFNKFKWWESVNTIDYNYTKSTSSIPQTNPILNGNSFEFSATNTFKISANFYLEGMYFYAPARVDGLFKVSSTNGLDLAIKMFFLTKSLQISIIGEDVFGSNRPIYTGYTNNIKLQNRLYFDNQVFRLSAVYKFGNQKLRTKQIKSNNYEQKGRVQ